MKKIDWQQAERKMIERNKAGESFWNRIINDPDFVKAKREIQAKYGLPVSYDIRVNNLEWIKWMGYDEKPTSQRAKRGQAFHKDVDALLKKFDISQKWHSDFYAEIAGNSIFHTSEISSFPEFKIYKIDDGTLKWECIITPETDLTNPLCLNMIQSQQKKYVGNPPKPAKDKMKPRKLDWRPVLEWYKRHPLFTLEEVAKMIGYTPQRVRQKFSELENDK